MSPKNSQNKIHIKNFDLLRLGFATMVLMFHAALLSESPSLRWMLHISSSFAVQAFFFVSGFLVTMSYENTPSIRHYLFKRALRILPAYFFVILACAILLGAVSTLAYSDYLFDPGFWHYIRANVLLSNFNAPSLPGVFINNNDPSVNGSLWTIKIEVAFYCLTPFLVYFVRRLGYKKVLGAVFIVSIVWRLGFTAFAIGERAELFEKFAKQLPGQLAFFAGGALAYYRARDGERSPPFWMAIAAALIYLVSDGWLYWIVAPIAVTIMVYWLALGGLRLWSPARYGDFSYGIYLFHYPLVQVLIALGYFSGAPLISTIVVFCVALGLAFLSWKWVESPFLRWSHK